MIQRPQYPKTMTHPVQPSVTVRSPDEEQEYAARGFAPFKVPEFSEYPKTLNHPNHSPAREITPESAPTFRKDLVGDSRNSATTARLASYVPSVWEEERFPPVTVNNIDEERRYAAEGYVVTGASDPKAFEAAQYTPSPQPEFLEYPKWVTAPTGESLLVKSQAEDAALQAKWAAPAAKPAKEARASR